MPRSSQPGPRGPVPASCCAPAPLPWPPSVPHTLSPHPSSQAPGRLCGLSTQHTAGSCAGRRVAAPGLVSGLPLSPPRAQGPAAGSCPELRRRTHEAMEGGTACGLPALRHLRPQPASCGFTPHGTAKATNATPKAASRSHVPRRRVKVEAGYKHTQTRSDTPVSCGEPPRTPRSPVPEPRSAHGGFGPSWTNAGPGGGLGRRALDPQHRPP